MWLWVNKQCVISNLKINLIIVSYSQRVKAAKLLFLLFKTMSLIYFIYNVKSYVKRDCKIRLWTRKHGLYILYKLVFSINKWIHWSNVILFLHFIEVLMVKMIYFDNISILFSCNCSYYLTIFFFESIHLCSTTLF